MFSSGVNIVYYVLKASKLDKVDDLRITGSKK
jgi:hypothetical protein